MKKRVPHLHVITDEVLQSRHTHLQLAKICAGAGADGIQYREKRTKQFAERIAVAVSMNLVCNDAGALLIVNDFVDVASRSDAPAIHLGQNDEAIDVARAKLPAETLLGGTANSLNEARLMASKDVDYIGVGPVFGTSSKASPAPPLGLPALKEICDAVDKPVVAIGNVQLQNVADVMAMGVHGVAVLSAITCARDIAEATRNFCEILGLPRT